MNTGDHVALIYPPGVELIAAFYGCLYVGVVPVTIRPPHPQVRSETKYKRICSASSLTSNPAIVCSWIVIFIFQNLQTTLPTVRMIVDVSKSSVILSSAPVIKLLKSKEASGVIDIKVKNSKYCSFDFGLKICLLIRHNRIKSLF